MQTPEPVREHRALEKLAGHFSGPERMHPSYWNDEAKKGEAVTDARVALDGFAIVQDYEQRLDDGSRFAGHGVFRYDMASETYEMHWFDSTGGPERVFRGGFSGRKLVLTARAGEGWQRLTYDFNLRKGYRLKLETSEDGNRWNVVLEGDNIGGGNGAGRTRTGTGTARKKTASRTTASKQATSKKATSKKAAGAKKTARKVPAKKTAGKKTLAKKAAAKKTSSRKTSAAARKTASKATTSKKTTGKKTTGKKAAAKKATAKKTSARKKAAARTTARGVAKRKASASKAGTKKTAARKANAKASTSRSTPGRKTAAKKTGAAKATARKAASKTAPRRKATARKASTVEKERRHGQRSRAVAQVPRTRTPRGDGTAEREPVSQKRSKGAAHKGPRMPKLKSTSTRVGWHKTAAKGVRES